MRLAPPSLRDLPAYRAIFLDSEIGAWLRPPPLRPFGTGDVVALLERDVSLWRREGWGPWLVHDEDGALVGRAGLDRTTVEGRAAIELAWSVLPPFQRRGFATAAAREAIELARRCSLTELVALALVQNVASRRVMEKLGMGYERDIEHAGLPHALYRLRLAR
jgi:RimJ/RimL family protein N-acetyltransferase